MDFLFTFPSETAGWMILLLGGLLLLALCSSAAFLLGGLQMREALHHNDSTIERLQDEIWELKEASAARERAEAASEAKSRFLASVSHEIRTPLNGIIGLADLLRGMPMEAEQASYVDAIRTSGSVLASLIDEILDFSKIEAGKFELVEEAFDVSSLVEGVVELLAPRAQGKGLEIASSIAANVPHKLMGDEARLRQVLMNLAGNAVKFTENGGIGLRVTHDNDQVRFAIIDTGPGIAEEHRQTIFEEFEQGDGSTTRNHGGTGLGLAISRRLVERMGGTLTLESPLSGGSVFSFALPCRPAITEDKTDEAEPRLTGRRALIIARSPFEAPYLGERLSDVGAQVVRAEGEEAGLAHLRASPKPDLVIVDCALGQETTKRLAEAARLAGVGQSLILFSPFERRAFGQTSARGFDGWLVKPVRSRSLFARLQNEKQFEDEDAPVAPLEDVSAPHLKQVLLAEDNEINALLATRHLEKLGARVTRAEDGVSAVKLALDAMGPERSRFDLIFMDIRMPGLDGLEAAKRIRLAEEEAASCRVMIVALTANAFDEDRKAAKAAGIDHFITKPFDVAQLKDILTLVDRSPSLVRA